MRYLLDTNILSQVAKHPQGVLAKKIKKLGDNKCCTSVIVACEMAFGAEKCQSTKLSQRINRILAAITILDLPAAASIHYAQIRASLESTGNPIGSNDMLIAAHALHLNLTLVSDNEKEFKRIPKLKFQNWLRE